MPLPSVPYAPSQRYVNPHVGTIADVIGRRGDTQAAARRASGQIWGQTLGTIGQIAAGGLSDYARERQDAPIRALTTQRLEGQVADETAARADRATARTEAAELRRNERAYLTRIAGGEDPATVAAEVFGRTPRGKEYLEGTIGFNALAEAAAGRPVADLKAEVGRTVKGMLAGSPSFRATLAPVLRQLAGGLGLPLDPAAELDDQALRGLAAWATGETPAGPTLEQVDPTKPLVNMATGETVRPGVPAPRTPSGQPFDAVVGGQHVLMQRWSDGTTSPLEGVRPYEPPRAPAAPSFQSREVIGDDGRPTMANFDARTGRYVTPQGAPITNPRPVPAASETQDARKFKQADPILASVEQLSERINTQQGLIAKMRGGAERVKAQANYNDDVAEYEAIVSGFTPLVARALGHTGVLTQQDVDSVKALFPKPGDSKTLRDRKITRIKGIIGALESGAAPAATADPLGILK